MLKIFAALAVIMAAGASSGATAPNTSRITRIEVTKSTPDSDGYQTITGVVHGVIDPREAVVGLASLPKNTAGQYEYASNFEIIRRGDPMGPIPYAVRTREGPRELIPVYFRGDPQRTRVIYIDSENRGSAISKGALGAFLKAHDVNYARVQWQTGISAGVPDSAQGVGLVIMRDFARLLSAKSGLMLPDAACAVAGPLPIGCPDTLHEKLILGGISQSAWFVNTFIAEGFNVDPVTHQGVFDAAIAVDGIGNWLAINNIAAARGLTAQTPYVDPNGRPLMRDELLKRPRTDPLYVDIANYTDYYRLRAGLTASPRRSSGFRRYDFPAMHAASRGMSAARCNGGVPMQQNPLGYAPYMRALVLGMEKQIGVKAARKARSLPDSVSFRLAKTQPPASPGFNPMPGVFTPVPVVDVNDMPMGGVRFPESRLPLGRPVPPSLPPAVTTSISETCGNSGGFQPFGRAELDARYGSRERYLGRYDAAIDRLVGEGFLLEEDRAAMLDAAAELYALWP